MTNIPERVWRNILQGLWLLAGAGLIGYGVNWRVGLGVYIIAGTLYNQLERIERLRENISRPTARDMLNHILRGGKDSQ